MEEWYLYCKKADFAAISEKFNISPMLARILRNREVNTDKEIEMYLHGSAADFYDPFLLNGMKEAVEIICETVKNRGKILIIGDYDADGVCSSYILYHYLEFAGADVYVRLPDRKRDGYGMNEAMADEADKNGISLIITCDNGISASEAVLAAKNRGIKVIVTDHHTPPEILPAADVIINPKLKDSTYPYREICGAAVCYKLICALSAYLKENNGIDSSAVSDYLLQFAGIATITDIVPLKDENRIFAKEALARLKNTQNPGLKALMQIKGTDKEKLSSYHIGFIIGPAINSAGRLKSADIAFDLLNETDPDKAYEKAQLLSQLNDERKKLTEAYSKEAFYLADKIAEKVIVVYLPHCHESVAGIIAGKIKEEKNRPAIVLTDSEEGIKGSGRSTDNYNIIEEISKHPELFKKFGGHARACGFTLKCAPEKLSDVLNGECSLTDEMLVKKIWADMQLPFNYATEEFARELSLTEPFGMENERPLFAQRSVSVLSSSIVGKRRNALKMRLTDKSGVVRDGIMFAAEAEISRIYEGIHEYAEISVLYYPEINEFRGKRSVQLKIQAIKFPEEKC